MPRTTVRRPAAPARASARTPGAPPDGDHSQLQAACRKPRPATERAFLLLETITSLGRPASLKELAAMQALPQATAFRLCQRMERSGLLVRDAGERRYSVGPRLLRLSIDVVRTSSSTNFRRAILSDLAAELGETCNLTMLAGSEVLYLDRVETAWPLRVSLEPGSRVPLHCTSSGKLFLALMPERQREEMIAALSLFASTPKSIIDKEELRRDLKLIARRGFGTNDEEFVTGLTAIAVPVWDSKGRVLAAVACHAPTSRMKQKELIAKVGLLQAAAKRMASTFELGSTDGALPGT